MRRHLRRVHRGSSGGNLFGWCDLPRCRQFGNKNESDYIKESPLKLPWWGRAPSNCRGTLSFLYKMGGPGWRHLYKMECAKKTLENDRAPTYTGDSWWIEKFDVISIIFEQTLPGIKLWFMRGTCPPILCRKFQGGYKGHQRNGEAFARSCTGFVWVQTDCERLSTALQTLLEQMCQFFPKKNGSHFWTLQSLSPWMTQSLQWDPFQMSPSPTHIARISTGLSSCRGCTETVGDLCLAGSFGLGAGGGSSWQQGFDDASSYFSNMQGKELPIMQYCNSTPAMVWNHILRAAVAAKPTSRSP